MSGGSRCGLFYRLSKILFYVIKFNANMWLLAIAYRWEITALMIVVPINSIYCFFSAHFIAKNEQIHMSVPCWALWEVTHSILTTLNWQSFISTQMTAHDDNDAWSELCVNSSTNDSIRFDSIEMRSIRVLAHEIAVIAQPQCCCSQRSKYKITLGTTTTNHHQCRGPH